ncbi:MAG: hypothetical protein II305_04430 [Clostridia bacterium]|nr:hypothetical protein [Clostridia bacterium]
MRQILAMISVDDNMAVEEDLGTIEYLEREFGWLSESHIFLGSARILDDDDPYDAKAVELANKIFEEEL